MPRPILYALVYLLPLLAVMLPASGRVGVATGPGLQNPGFEDGTLDGAPQDWTVEAASDAVAVVDTEGPSEFTTYAAMGNVTVSPYRGDLMLRLGIPRDVNAKQPSGANTVSQEFSSHTDPLRIAVRLFSWDHRGIDEFSFNLTDNGAPVGDLSEPLIIKNSNGDTVATCNDIPCVIHPDVGKQGDFIDSGWMPVEIVNIPSDGRTLKLTYSVAGVSNEAHPTWAYFDNVNTPPIARFSFEPEDILEGDIVQFTDSSFDPDGDEIVSWDWDINGTALEEQNPIFIFPDEGTYTACLTVSDGLDTDTVCTNSTARDGTFIDPLTLGNQPPLVNALNMETLAGEPATAFGRLLEPGWQDVVSATLEVGGQNVPVTVEQDNLEFLSTGIVTGEFSTDASTSGTLTISDADGGSNSDAFNVTVVPDDPQRHEPADNDLTTAPVVAGDGSYLSWIQSAGDQDFFKVELPTGGTIPPGGQLLVTLSDLPADYDLVILAEQPDGEVGFEEGDAGQVSYDTAGWRFGGWRFGGWRFGGWRFGGWRFGGWRFGGWRFGGWRFGSSVYPLSHMGFNSLSGDSIGTADISLEELGLNIPSGDGLTVAGYSGNLGTGNEAALVAPDAAGTTFYVAVVGANGSFSSEPYTLSVETSVPLDPALALGPEVCSKSPLVGADPSNPATSTVVDLNPDFPAAGSEKTLIVTQRERIIALYDNPDTAENEGLARWDTMIAKLQALAQHPSVMADIISVPSTFYDSWDSNPCDVEEANAVAANVRGQIMAKLSESPAIQYVVLAGDDDVVPQRRVPDETVIGNETNYVLESELKPGAPLYSSLLEGFILSDDYYVDLTPTPWQGRELYVPDMPLGRLTETPEEIGAAADAFVTSNGLLDYSTADTANALVTGYDFFDDSASAQAANLGSKFNVDTLISETWTADDLRCRLLGQPVEGLAGCSTPSVGAVNAHFLHMGAISASGYNNDEFDFLNSTEIAVNTPALERKIVYTMGCHAGFSVPDRAAQPADLGIGLDPAMDLVQAMAQQNAVYIASTGYGLGDDEAIAGTELLLTNFSAELVESNAVIGDALVDAKQSFILGLLSMTVYDEKSSIQTTLFGLPMYEVVTAESAPQVLAEEDTSQSTTLSSLAVEEGININIFDLGTVTTTSHSFSEVLTDRGSYYTADGDSQVTAFRPIQPRVVIPIESSGLVQGVLLKSGSYTDLPSFDPVISLPKLEWQLGDEEPQVCLDSFWPSVIVELNTLDPNDPNSPQALVITPGKFRCTDVTSGTVTGTQRLYTDLTVELLHSDPSDQTPPTVSSVDLTPSGENDLEVTVNASDASGIKTVSIVKSSGGTLETFELNVPQPYPTSGQFSVIVTNFQDGDSISGQVVDGADNVANITGKGAELKLIRVDAGPDRGYAPGVPVTFEATIENFSSLTPPVFFFWDFGDGNTASGEVTSATFTTQHTYSESAPDPVTAKLRVMDSNGGIGNDSVELHRCLGTPPDGYDCTPLTNKGTGQTVGELYFLRDGTNITLLTDMFSGPDTGHSQPKLCVDDDPNPQSSQTSCLGATSAVVVKSCGALPSASSGESDGGLYEAMLEGEPLAESSMVVNGQTLARFDVCVDEYEFFSFHFNSGGLSVEAFFIAPP